MDDNFSEGAGPLFSVITPVYNRADCIIDCMRSVANQAADGFVFEHVVVDDGSSDNTFQVAADFASSHPSVKLLRLSQNSGTNAARNAAVRAASGRFIVILDSDDTMCQGALQLMAGEIARNPGIGHFLFATDDRSSEFASRGLLPGQVVEYGYRDFLEGGVGGDFSHVLLRETMLKYPFDESLRIFEGIFFLSFFKEADRMRFVNIITLCRDRSRDDRVTFTLIPDNARTLRTTVQSIDMLYERFNADLQQTPRGRSRMAAELLKKHRFATMLGMRYQVRLTEGLLARLGVKAPLVWRLLNVTGLGRPFFAVARHYVRLKTLLGVRPD